MFIDEVVIEVAAGRGGHGMKAFRREKYVEFGGPSGGNGGNGGDVVFVGDSGKHTLLEFRYRKHIRAKDGENGKSKGMQGANAIDEEFKVPLGTVVYDFETNKKIGEITFHGQRLVVAKGGRGGRGNMAFVTSKNRAPHFSENGDFGEQRKIKIDLRVLADVGLLGFPNVGKSTFISTVSNARPKIADYPFTTLQPNLGMVNHKNADFVIADLPGLIENASKGEGLGIRFLKHLERCRIFLHFIDLSDEKAFEKYEIINNELGNFSKELLNRKQIIVLNKSDIVDDNTIAEIKNKFNNEVYIISAINRKGIEELLDKIVEELASIPPIVKEEEKHTLYELEENEDKIDIVVENGIFYVTGKKVEVFYYRTNFNEEESIRRFTQQLRSIGIEDALRAHGIKNGDTVNVYGFEFDYID